VTHFPAAWAPVTPIMGRLMPILGRLDHRMHAQDAQLI